MSRSCDLAPTSIVFTTENTPVESRLDMWNTAFGSLNAITIPAELNAPPSVHCENWLLGGGMVLSQTRVAGGRFLRDTLRARRDQLDHWVIRVVKQGQCRVQQSGYDCILGPGQLMLFSLHETWTIDWLNSEWISLCIPRDMDLPLSGALSTVPSGLVQGVGGGLLADLVLSLPMRLRAARPEEIPGLSCAVRLTVGACLHAVERDKLPETVAGIGYSWAKERVRRVILKNAGSSQLKPEQIASAAGLSRSALYRLFEPEGGVARYIRQLRLSLAHAALRDPDQAHRSIAAIAEDHGFADASDFTRAFKAVYGIPPRSVRGDLAHPPLPFPAMVERDRIGNQDLMARIYA